MSEKLDDILSDKPAAKPEAEAPATDKPAGEPAERPAWDNYESKKQRAQRKEWEAQGRDPETGQWAKKDDAEPKADPKAEPKAEAKAEPEKPKEPVKSEAPAAPAQPKEEFTARERAFLATATEERRKRQALEQQLKEAKPAEPAKTFFEDPEAHLAAVRNEVKTEIVRSRLDTTEAIARSRYPDFNEKIAIFTEVLEQTPGLAQQWLSQPDPAEFAYNVGKKQLEFRQAGSVDALKEKWSKELRGQWEKEQKDKEDKARKEREALPGSLSDTPGSVSRPHFTGPTSLEDILKGPLH